MHVPALRFKKLVKSYGQLNILKGVSFDVQRAEIFGLVGMNGAGKTTLFKCLLDFCDTNEGDIEIFGIKHQLNCARAPLFFLPERFLPPYYLTGQNFIDYMLKLHGMAFCSDTLTQALHELDFDLSALTRSVRSYSKGMTQKLGLLGCFLVHKDLYILDEPMSGLDPKARALLKSRLQVVRARGGTVFFSSHALADVEELCDRMAILHDGELRFLGSPAACRQQFSANTLEQAYLQCIRSDNTAK